MPYQFTVSPDFSPEHLSGWYIFNTWLQKQSGAAIHLALFDSYQLQREEIQLDHIDLIYANPFDAAMLVREKGFMPLVKPLGLSDEAVIAVNANDPITDVADFPSGIKVALTEAPDVRMMGLMMLESGDLSAVNTQVIVCDTYILVAKQLLQGNADAGFFLAEAYDDLSNMIRSKLRILVRSQISVIYHSLMLSPKLAYRKDDIQHLLLSMGEDEKGNSVLKSLGFDGWAKVEDEDMEFMIDLMNALAI